MIYNKYMLSTLRQMRARDKEGTSPMAMFVRLMNELHSMDLKYFPTEQERMEAKSDISKMIRECSIHIPPAYRKNVNRWIKSKDAWKMHIGEG